MHHEACREFDDPLSWIGLQIKAGNLQPALDWAAEHRQQLTASTSDSVAKSFEFKLHRLQFLDVLGKQGAPHASSPLSSCSLAELPLSRAADTKPGPRFG